jgi:Tol biopolymer transport system component
MNADGSDQRQLTFSPADDDFAMWAPHGRSLVFNSERDKEP